MKHLLLAATAAVGLAAAVPAHAVLLTSFAQNSDLSTVTATDDGTTTTISYTDASTTLAGGVLPNFASAFMTLNAKSVDAVTNVGGNLIQHYTGSFCISTVAGCGGQFLSGTFTDAAFGANGGPGLTVNVNDPPESLTLASNETLILDPPSAFSLAFVSLAPALHVDGTTIGAFTAAFSGDISATAPAVPEPASIALLGVGLLGLGVAARRQRR